MLEWPTHYQCAYCYRSPRLCKDYQPPGFKRRNWADTGCFNCGLPKSDHKPHTRATWRFFAGIGALAGAAGGYPACDLHRVNAETAAMATLYRSDCPEGWEVDCNRIETDEHDDPVMKPVWTASRRS